MRPITKAALGGLAGSALVFGTMQAANGASTETYKYTGALRDVRVVDGPYDSTHAKVTIVQQDTDSTQFSIKITGIDISASGEKVGAHLHIGPCVEGNGDAAGRHYNSQMVPAGTLTNYADAEKSPTTEVWFDLVPSAEDGAASFTATVPFVPKDLDGVMSIVVHIEPTRPVTGFANSRQACFPLYVPQWIPKPTT
jgi:superoxide dismutase, Cu-Zn family